MGTQFDNEPIIPPSLSKLAAIEPKVKKLSLHMIDEEDQASTSGKTIKISNNVWHSLSPAGQYYLLCHEVGHYLKGHNSSGNRLIIFAFLSLILVAISGGWLSLMAFLVFSVIIGMMIAYSRHFFMTKEYEADQCGYDLLQRIYPDAYLIGMKEMNTFHVIRNKKILSGEALNKELATLAQHLFLKENHLKAYIKKKDNLSR